MFLLDDGPKRLENRDWPPPKRMLGQLLALHGGALPKPGERKYLKEIQHDLTYVGEVFDDPDAGVSFSDEELLGFCVPGIYGVARLSEVVQRSDDPWFTGPFGWVLSDFVPIDPPLVDHSPSHQGLWTIEPGTLATLRVRYRAAQGGTEQAADPAPQPLAPALPPRASQPELFCPGTPITNLKQTFWPGTLYGLAVGDEWITVTRATGGLCRWRAMRGGQTGEGPRSAFDDFVAQMQELVA